MSDYKTPVEMIKAVRSGQWSIDDIAGNPYLAPIHVAGIIGTLYALQCLREGVSQGREEQQKLAALYSTQSRELREITNYNGYRPEFKYRDPLANEPFKWLLYTLKWKAEATVGPTGDNGRSSNILKGLNKLWGYYNHSLPVVDETLMAVLIGGMAAFTLTEAEREVLMPIMNRAQGQLDFLLE